MGILNNIAAEEAVAAGAEATSRDGRTQRLHITFDVGRNVVLAVVLLGILMAIVALYATGNDAAGRVLVDAFVAVLSGGLGVNAGERAAARETARLLGEHESA